MNTSNYRWAMTAALLLVTALLMLTGCGSLGGMGGMSDRQIEAAVKDKSSAAVCIDSIGPGWKISTLVVNNDKTFGSAGGETTLKCAGGEVTFKDAGKAGAPKP